VSSFARFALALALVLEPGCPAAGEPSPPTATATAPEATRLVERAVDGDTLVLDGGERLRLIGVDTPETHHTRRKSGAECFGQEAWEFTRDRVVGREVRVVFERGERRDRYGRTLGYVYLGDGAFLNLELLEQGYARVYRAMPRRFKVQFFGAERDARDHRRGLWGPTCSATSER